MFHRLLPVQHLDLANHLIEIAEAEFGHDLAHLLSDEEEVVDDVFRLTCEPLAQNRVLRGDTDGAGVEVALAHHDATCRDQRRSGEAELVRPEQGADDDVATRSQAAIDLHGNTGAQFVAQQGLVGFGQPHFPWRAAMFDRGKRRCTGTTFHAGNRHMIRACLGHTSSDRADADFGDQLDRNIQPPD